MAYEIKIENDKQAVFEKDTDKRISEWFHYIYSYGLVNGDSDFYLAGINDKIAIYHKSGKRVSEWFDYVYYSGLVDGTSNSYKADGKIYKYDKIKFLINEVNK